MPLFNTYGVKHPLTRLSAFWSQHQIGHDLAIEELIVLEKKQKPAHQVTLGIADIEFNRSDIRGSVDRRAARHLDDRPLIEGIGIPDHHGVMTANLLNAPFPFGIAHSGIITSFVNRESFTKTRSGLEKLFLFIKRGTVPKVYVFETHTVAEIKGTDSGDYGKYALGDEYIRHLSDLSRNSIVVAAAGNHYPEGSADNVLRGADIILVGNSSVHGWVKFSSDESNDVTVLAPAGEGIPGAGFYDHDPVRGDYFSGTSAATPLVAGAVANALSILGQLNAREARILLMKTATQNAIVRTPIRRNGAGVLNEYRLLRVAMRLREAGWPAKRGALLDDPAIFDFRQESAERLKTAMTALALSDPKNREIAFVEARKAFLLEPTIEAAKIIAEFYAQEGFELDASFYRNYDPEVMRTHLLAIKALESEIKQSFETGKYKSIDELPEIYTQFLRQYPTLDASPEADRNLNLLDQIP